MTGARILVVDDETHLATGIQENLAAEGYLAQAVHDGAAGLALALAEPHDLIVLDVSMPTMDGLTMCRELRRNGNQTPVLFLTVRGSAEDRVLGLEAGGDDYLAKPFHLRELLLRIAAILRRTTWYRTTGAVLEFAGNRVNFHTYQATAWDGQDYLLTHKEALILKMLSERVGDTVGREEILDTVWGFEVYPSTRVIDDFVVRLRERFERDPQAPVHLHTAPGVGYRFTTTPESGALAAVRDSGRTEGSQQ